MLIYLHSIDECDDNSCGKFNDVVTSVAFTQYMLNHTEPRPMCHCQRQKIRNRIWLKRTYLFWHGENQAKANKIKHNRFARSFEPNTIFYDSMLGKCHSTSNCIIFYTLHMYMYVHTDTHSESTAGFICTRFQSHVTIVSLVVSGACCQCRCHFVEIANQIDKIGPNENHFNFTKIIIINGFERITNILFHKNEIIWKFIGINFVVLRHWMSNKPRFGSLSVALRSTLIFSVIPTQEIET